MTVELYQVREEFLPAGEPVAVMPGGVWGREFLQLALGFLELLEARRRPLNVCFRYVTSATLEGLWYLSRKREMVVSFHCVIWKLHTAWHCQVNLFSSAVNCTKPFLVAKCTKSSKVFCHNSHPQRCRNFRAELSCSRTCSREGILPTQTQQRKKWFHSERRFLLFTESGKCVTGSSEVMEGSNLEGSNPYTQWETEFIEEMPPHPYPSPKPIFCPRKDNLSDTGHALVFLKEK